MVAIAAGITAITSVFSGIKKVGASTWKKFGTGMKDLGKAAAQSSGLENFFNLGSILQPVIDLLEPLNGLFSVFGAVLQEALAPAMEDLFDILLSDEVIGLVTKLAESFGIVLVPVLETFTTILDTLIQSGALDLFMDAITAIALGIAEFVILISPHIDELVGLFGDFINFLVQTANAFSGDISDLGPIFADVIDEFINGIGLWFLQKIRELEIAVGQAVIDFFTWLGGEIWSAIQDAGKFLGEIGAFIGAGFVNAIIAMGNLVIDIINGLDFADVFEDIPSIEYIPVPALTFLANGGIARGPTPAMIGDAGPEAVIPLDEGEDELSGILGTNITINITGPIGDEQIRDLARRMQLIGATEFTGRGMSF
jgi:hypothetical protein